LRDPKFLTPSLRLAKYQDPSAGSRFFIPLPALQFGPVSKGLSPVLREESILPAKIRAAQLASFA
jgi:hypothetical protein